MKSHNIIVFILLLSTIWACSNNQYLNITTNSCYLCSSLCSTCTNSSSCTSCLSSYYLNNGVCSSCQSPCISCQSVSSCSKCSRSYYLSNSSCVVCTAQCSCDGASQICSTISTQPSILLLAVSILSPILLVIIILLIIRCCCKCCDQESQPENNNDVQRTYQQSQIVEQTQTFKLFGALLDKQKKQWCISKNNQAINRDEICTICLLEFPDTKTNCNHLFHYKCLVTWLKKKVVCPMCKRERIKVRKYCSRCAINYVQCNLNKLNSYLVEFYQVCVFCKNDVRRLQTLSQLQMINI